MQEPKFSGLFNRMSLFVKCMLLIVVSTLTLAALLTVANNKMQERSIVHGVQNLGRNMTVEVASTSGGSIRFKNTGPLADRLEGVLSRTHGRATYGVALDSEGGVIAEAGTISKADRSALAGLASAALEAGEMQSDATGFITAAPSKVGTTGDNFVGSVAFVWTPEVDISSLGQGKLIALGVASLAFLALVALSAFALHRLMGVPLARVGESISGIAQGTYDDEPIYQTRGDEIGRIGRHLEELKEQLQIGKAAEDAQRAEQEQQEAVVAQLSKGLQSLSEGDLTRTLDKPFASNYEELRLNFNTTVQKMLEIIGTVVENSTRIQAGATEISQSSDDLSHRTESQAATLEETAAAMEELTVSVKSAADGARQAESIAMDAKTTAENSDTVVTNAVNAMSQIEESSSKISQIITVIDDISFQTNLLALNAGVEAARAGEAGRGFAVVASEVRALAQRSSDAAMEIKSLISESANQVNQGVDLVGRAGQELKKITERVGEISEHISGIAAGAAEQAITLTEINTGVSQLDQVTQQNAAMVEEATAAGQLLRNDASALAQHVSVFNTGQGSSNTVPFTPAEPTMPTAHGSMEAELEAQFIDPPKEANRWDDF